MKNFKNKVLKIFKILFLIIKNVVAPVLLMYLVVLVVSFIFKAVSLRIAIFLIVTNL